MPAKRILVLTNRVPYPLNDGGNLAMNAMIIGYSKLGWEVYLLSMNTSRHYIGQTTLDSIYKDIYCFETIDVDNNITFFQLLKNFMFSSKSNHEERFYTTNYSKKLVDVVKEFKPHVIQMESLYLASYLDDVKPICKSINVLRLHNVEYQIWYRLAKESSILKKAYLNNLARRIKAFEEKAWKKFDLLLPITDTDAKEVKGVISNDKLLVSPYGLSSLADVDDKHKEQWVGYHIGAMDWQPNIEGVKWFLQDVWHDVKNAIPSFEFYFAGRNMPRNMLDVNIEGIHCEGMVEDADEFISNKKILIVPLKSGGGIRVKVLEAMSKGKIVISTTVGVQGIDVQPNIHFIQADTKEGFVRSIQWCLDNKKEAQEIAENAKRLINSKYDANAIIRVIDTRLQGIIGKF